jgi:hypothetical protein
MKNRMNRMFRVGLPVAGRPQMRRDPVFPPSCCSVTALLVLAVILTSCAKKQTAAAPPPPPPLSVRSQTPPAPQGNEPSADNEPTRATIANNRTKREAATLQLSRRPALADYVPCRFTDPQESDLRQGFIPGSANGDRQTLKAAARQPGSGVSAANQAAFATMVDKQSDAFTAISAAMDAKLITSKAAEQLSQTLAAAPMSQTSTNDVSCSQSMLTWNEARWIFGRKIADTYIAIQVNARNLSGDKEFLIHDLQVAVADFKAFPNEEKVAESCMEDSGSVTHFVAGHDRMLVRGVGQTGQQFTTRNITARLLESLGSVFGAAALVAGGPSFGSAVHIFNAAGVPGFGSALPDLTVDQLNRLNDLGFSSSSAYKIVIPKNGSVPMTTFLPSDIFAEKYRNWHHCQLLNFQENMVVVLGGKHIQEESSTPQLSATSCPLNGGLLDFSKAANDNFQCTMTGTALQLLTSVRLKNADDQTDSTTADGTTAVSGRTDSGTVTFSVKTLSGLTGKNYLAFGESASGESASATKLSMPPTLSKAVPTQLQLDVTTNGCDGSACTLTLTGNHLDLVSEARLITSSDRTPVARVNLQSISSTGATAPFVLSDLKSAGLSAATVCNLVLGQGGATFDTGVQITITPKGN